MKPTMCQAAMGLTQKIATVREELCLKQSRICVLCGEFELASYIVLYQVG